MLRYGLTLCRFGGVKHTELGNRLGFRLLLQHLIPFDGQNIPAAVAALYASTLAEIPKTHLQVFPRASEQLLQLNDGQGWLLRLIHSLGTEQRQNTHPFALLGFKAMCGARLIEDFPLQSSCHTMFDVVGGAAFRIAQHPKRLQDLVEEFPESPVSLLSG